MDYIKKVSKGILVSHKGEEKLIKKGLRQFFNELLINEYVTLSGRLEAIKRKHRLFRNIPIYINHSHCFYTLTSIRSNNTLCLNYYQILSFQKLTKTQTLVLFTNLSKIIVEMEYERILKKHSKVTWFLELMDKEHT